MVEEEGKERKPDNGRTAEEGDHENDPPTFLPDETGSSRGRREQTGAETGEDLRFNDEAGSFELDAETPDPPDTAYQHPDPHDTAVPGATDHMSTYDEANQFTPNEYRDIPEEIADNLETLNEAETRDRFIDLDKADEKLAETPEDERGDLDEEGYPVRDDPGGDPDA